jgi:hypothetical protein
MYEEYVELWDYLEEGYKSSLLLPREWKLMPDDRKITLLGDMKVAVAGTLSYDRYIKLRRAARHEGEVKPGFQEYFDLSQDGWNKQTFYLRRKMIDGLLIETKGSTPKCDPDHENFYPETWGNW